MVKNNEGWKVFDYGDLLPIIDDLRNRTTDVEKKLFINHYLDFLKEYYSKYNNLDKNIVSYLKNQKEKENKFWISLLYSNLATRFENYFDEKSIEVSIVANTGNTKTPIINIIPRHWNVHDKELLIQIQDGKFKFYAHTGDKIFLAEIKEFISKRVKNDFAKIKNNVAKVSKTECILSIDILDKIDTNYDLSADKLFDLILVFYDRIDKEIIGNYS